MLEYKLALLVFLAALVRLVVFPTHNLAALAASYVADNVAARRHVALARLAGFDINDCVEEVGLPMLASEVLFPSKMYD